MSVEGEVDLEPNLAKTAPRDIGMVRKFVVAMDDGVRIPFTEQGIGLDAIIGFLLPGAGDALTGMGSITLLGTALRHRVPTVVLLRMILNIGIDVLLGAVPFVGDVFDIFWRSNRRNLALIDKHAGAKEKASVGDYLVVGLGILLALAAIALPFVMIYWLGSSLLAYFRS